MKILTSDLGGTVDGVDVLDVRCPDKEDVAFLSAMESSHGMNIQKHAVPFGCEVEVFQNRFDD